MNRQRAGRDQPLLSIVTVTWNHRDEMDEYIHALAAAREELPFAIEVLVVDNDSADGTAEYIEKAAPWIRVLRSGYNAGFAEGCNIGLRAARGGYLMLLNPDALATAPALRAMVRFLRRNPEVGGVGCRLLHGDGLPQFSAYPRLGPLSYMVHNSGVYPIMERLRKVAWKAGLARGRRPVRVGWLQGSCHMVPRRVYEAVGGLDPSYFMYCEDTDWCRRIEKAGFVNVFLPRVEMRHRQKGSVGRAPEWCFRRVYRSNLHYANTHMAGWERRTFLGVVLADMYLRIPVYMIAALLLPSRREFLRGRIASVRTMTRILRSGDPDHFPDPPPGRAAT